MFVEHYRCDGVEMERGEGHEERRRLRKVLRTATARANLDYVMGFLCLNLIRIRITWFFLKCISIVADILWG